MEKSMEVLGDAEGAVTFGWVDDGVLYSRFEGALSVGVGTEFAERLRIRVFEVPALKYFSDASKLESYDLLARSAFVRVVLPNRRKFTSMVMLTWAGGVSPIARAFSTVIGECVEVLTHRGEFAARLLRAAPLAGQLLDTSPRRLRTQPPLLR
jgi:hypothetical protein